MSSNLTASATAIDVVRHAVARLAVPCSLAPKEHRPCPGQVPRVLAPFLLGEGPISQHVAIGFSAHPPAGTDLDNVFRRVRQSVTIRVVLVEDLPSMRDLMADLFGASEAFRLAAVIATEAEAKFWFEEHPRDWDVAVVDLILSQGSGFGVIQRARSTHPDGTVVVFSGFAGAAIAEHCRNLGADAVFDKADPGRFLTWLRELRATRPGG